MTRDNEAIIAVNAETQAFLRKQFIRLLEANAPQAVYDAFNDALRSVVNASNFLGDDHLGDRIVPGGISLIPPRAILRPLDLEVPQISEQPITEAIEAMRQLTKTCQELTEARKASLKEREAP